MIIFANSRLAWRRSAGRATVGHFPDFICRRQGDAAIWIDRGLVKDELVGLLKDPDALFSRPGAQLVKNQRKIKVACVPVALAGQHCHVYVKRFNAFSWRYRLASLLFSSGAVRALRGGHVLIEAQIPAARAIAALEFRRWGMLTKSFFLTEEIAGGKTADAYWREDLQSAGTGGGRSRRQDFLRLLAALFRRLHDLNIYHNDLKDANILVVPGSDHEPESIFLLDLEGIRRYRKLNQRRKIKNLVQLNRTLGTHLARREKLVFIKFYLSHSFADLRERKRWIKAVLRQSREKDRKKSDIERSAAGGNCERR